jgi:DNA-binding MarR family transcriptional regulator
MDDRELNDVLREINLRFDAIISLFARLVLKAEEVKEIIQKGAKDKERIVRCFNLCDGKMNLTDIAKRAKLDQGALSRRIDSWEKEGFIIKIEKEGKVYPKALLYLK